MKLLYLHQDHGRRSVMLLVCPSFYFLLCALRYLSHLFIYDEQMNSGIEADTNVHQHAKAVRPDSHESQDPMVGLLAYCDLV